MNSHALSRIVASFMARRQAHVWRVELEAPGAEHDPRSPFLSEAERLRAERFRFAQHRRRFVAAHVALRSILAAYLNLAPERLVFTYSDRAKPSVDMSCNGIGLAFNLSHSGSLAVIALTRNARIGVDVEYVDAGCPAWEDVARRFSAQERDALNSLNPSERIQAFYHFWTFKEALLKAAGVGIGAGLDRFSIALDYASPRILHADLEWLEPTQWWLKKIDMPGYAAALALEGKALEVQVRAYDWA